MLRRLPGALLALAAGIACSGPVSSQTNLRPASEYVDLALILAVDVSRSMDFDEQRVQRDGYVAAFRSAELHQAVRSGLYGRIAVAYMEWSSAYYQQVLVPWTVIGTSEEINAFADQLDHVPITTDSRTSISHALQYAHNYFRMVPATPDRRTIDVSGDGANNDGLSLIPIRDRIVADGVTINGLPIVIRPSNLFGPAGNIWLDDYYRACVTGGPASFVIAVNEVKGFAAAIRRKLILEIVGIAPEVMPVASPRSPNVDCNAADQQRNFNDPLFR
jgi:hypothetical protein